MIVVAHLKKYYDWDQVPKDVVVTEQDIFARKVMPGRLPGDYRMKVPKVPLAGACKMHGICTVRTTTISESTLIEKIIEEKSDYRKGGRTLSRNEAAAQCLQDHTLTDEHLEWPWIIGFEVHDDGPSEELFRAKLEPHTQADHGRRRRKNIPPEHLADHVAAYLKDWKTLPVPSFADAEKPTDVELHAHAALLQPLRESNHLTLIQHLSDHFGVR
jgi:hypothetical protein